MSKKILSVLLALVMVLAMSTVALVSVSADLTDLPEVPDGYNRYYFYMPEQWINDYTNVAGIYWWEGTDACTSWPGYEAYPADYTNVYYYDVPQDVTTIIWSNFLDGGQDPTLDIYTAAVQTVNIGSEYYDAGESANYPDGTDSFDGMIYVTDMNKIDTNPFSGKQTFGGEWAYYYGNGEYGFTPEKGAEVMTDPAFNWTPDATIPKDTGSVTEATGDTDATTVAPTTEATTVAPTTEATTVAPTTEATTVAPTTEATTVAPTTEATTVAPTTEATTVAPTTEATTVAPTTEATTVAPTTEATTVAPTTEATTAAPTTEATTVAPTTAAPKADVATIIADGTAFEVPVGETFTYEFTLTTPTNIENMQATSKYDETIVELIPGTARQMFPVLRDVSSVIYNVEMPGVVKFNATEGVEEGFNFTEGGILASFQFKVLTAGTTTISTTIEEMVKFGEAVDYATGGVIVNDEVKTAETIIGGEVVVPGTDPTTEATTVAPTTEATTVAPTTEDTDPTEVTTVAPTTEATTVAPTTEDTDSTVVTTVAPTTEVTDPTEATTVAPTTEATTAAPTTEATTAAPTTAAPTTVAPTTEAPTTEAPTTVAPTTAAPVVTEAPATTAAPVVTEAPATTVAPGTTAAPATGLTSATEAGTTAAATDAPNTGAAAYIYVVMAVLAMAACAVVVLRKRVNG